MKKLLAVHAAHRRRVRRQRSVRDRRDEGDLGSRPARARRHRDRRRRRHRARRSAARAADHRQLVARRSGQGTPRELLLERIGPRRRSRTAAARRHPAASWSCGDRAAAGECAMRHGGASCCGGRCSVPSGASPAQRAADSISTRERARVVAAAERYLDGAADHDHRVARRRAAPAGRTTSSPKGTTGGRIRRTRTARTSRRDGMSQSRQLRRPPPRADAAVASQCRRCVRPGRLTQRRALRARTRERTCAPGSSTPATRMNPNLRYAQAIHGVSTGRGTGIIDTIHLVEVARALERARRRAGLAATTRPSRVRRWFAEYLDWLTTRSVRHRGARRDQQSRHLLGDAGRRRSRISPATRQLLAECRDAFKTVLVPSRWRPTAASRASWRAPSRTATRCSTSTRWRRSARSSRRRRTISGRSSSPTAAACARDGVHGRRSSATRRPGRAARRHVRRRLADAAGEPALRGPGAR